MKQFVYLFIGFALNGCSMIHHKNEINDEQRSFFSWVEKITNRKSGKATPLEYMEFVEDRTNHLVKEKQIGDFLYKVQYKPLEYEALRNLEEATLSKRRLDSISSLLEDMSYFTFSIQNLNGENDFLKSNTSDYTAYQKLLNYLSNDLKNDFTLVHGKDSLPCLIHHYERTFGMNSDVKVVLAFGLPKSETQSDDLTLIYDDKLFNTGIIKVRIAHEDIKQCPSLTFNTNENI